MWFASIVYNTNAMQVINNGIYGMSHKEFPQQKPDNIIVTSEISY